MKFEEINLENLNFNVFGALKNEWMLIVSWNESETNIMTASWGGFGFVWSKNIAISFIRPQRHTFHLMNNNKYHSLCFFDPKNLSKYRSILNFCGKESGKNIDKIKETGLTTINDGNFKYFEEASTVICCKKIYSQFICQEYFEEKDIINNNYPLKDYHKMFIGEISKFLVKSKP
ncbi:MAG: flavin reductase family protein [Oscillospiraceae bacterium]|jgi:flavin reductase (DIM6/NTAB) family NADH-FMN oxidoreductase RutF|nr:flavin reductase family protein [Oscillospiraceae bacterium]